MRTYALSIVYYMYMKYVALFRGINVGGNRKVPMAELRQQFEALGYTHVSTYINSGNVLFESEAAPDVARMRVVLEAHFGFTLDILILSARQVITIADAIPADWTNDMPKPDKSGQKSDVLYLFDNVNAPDVLTRIGYRPDIETMQYVDGAVLANITRRNQTKYSILRIVGTPLYRGMTIRNITTAKKLADLVRE